MTQDPSFVSRADRVALLRQGIVVLSADADARRVSVAGDHESWVVPAVVDRLGAGIDVDVRARLPRELRPIRCEGYMERELGRLQLRYVMVGDEHLDEITVAEDEHHVVVYGTVCAPVGQADVKEVECPYHVYLERPLGSRTVIDGVCDVPVPYKNVYDEIKKRLGQE